MTRSHVHVDSRDERGGIMKLWRDIERGTRYRGFTPPSPRERWWAWKEVPSDRGITLCAGCDFPADEAVESFSDWVMSEADIEALINHDLTRELKIWCPNCHKEGLHLRA